MIGRYFTVSSQPIRVAVSTLYRSSLKKAALGHRLMLLSLFCLIVASAMLVFPIPALAGEKYGTFTPVGEMNIPRGYHTATLLPNGKVLIAGGIRGFRDVLDSAELYDPALHKFTLTEKMLSVRAGHTATLLRDGKVLIAGGFRSGEALASAELYDPVQESSALPARWWSLDNGPPPRCLPPAEFSLPADRATKQE